MRFSKEYEAARRRREIREGIGFGFLFTFGAFVLMWLPDLLNQHFLGGVL